MTELWHYTCAHGREALGMVGDVQPLRVWNPRAAQRLTRLPHLADLSWFTDLEAPWARELGLTMTMIYCDRTAHRYRVIGDRPPTPWVRSPLRRGAMVQLEREAGAMPMHWYVATWPVPVVLDER